MSIGGSRFNKQLEYWQQRSDLQTRIQQLEATVADAHDALLNGQIPAAQNLFQEAREQEQQAQQLATQLEVDGPTKNVIATLTQAIEEKRTAIIQGELINAATLTQTAQEIQALEQQITGIPPVTAKNLPAQLLLGSTEQAITRQEYARATEYLESMTQLEPNNEQVQLQMAELLLLRATTASTKMQDGESALRYLNRARTIYEQARESPAFASRRRVFEDNLNEASAATYFAVAEQSRRQFRLQRAREYYAKVPPLSAYGTQAQEGSRSLGVQLAGGIVALIVLGGVIAGLSIFARPNTVAVVPTATVLQATVVPATVNVPTTGATTATGIPSPTNTSEPTAKVTVSATPEVVANGSPTPNIAPAFLLRVRAAARDLEVYKTAERFRVDRVLTLNDQTSVYLVCNIDGVNGSYQIARSACSPQELILGWVNQKNVVLIAEDSTTLTATTTPTPTP